jgi:hypothetical protein
MCHGCEERDTRIYQLEEEKRQLRSQLQALLLHPVPSRKRRRGVGSAAALRLVSVNADTTIQRKVDNKVEFDLPSTYECATTDREEAMLGLT